MLCLHCYANMPDDSRFCPYCGNVSTAPVITPEYCKTKFRAVWHILTGSPLLLAIAILLTLFQVITVLGSETLYSSYAVFIKALLGRNSLFSEIVIHLLLLGEIGAGIMQTVGLWFLVAEGRRLLERPVDIRGLQLIRNAQIVSLCTIAPATLLQLIYTADLYSTFSYWAGLIYGQAYVDGLRAELISQCVSTALSIAVSIWLLRLLSRMLRAAKEETPNTKGMRLYSVLLLVCSVILGIVALIALLGGLWMITIMIAVLGAPGLLFALYMRKAKQLFDGVPVYVPVKPASIPASSTYNQEPTWKRIAREQEQETEQEQKEE